MYEVMAHITAQLNLVPSQAFFSDVLLTLPPNYAWLWMQVSRQSRLN